MATIESPQQRVESARQQASKAMAAQRGQRLAWLLIGVIIAVGAVTGVRRAVRNRPDWQPLHDDVCYVWEHGHTAPGTTMFGYLPTTTFALLPFMAWLPVAVGAPLYALTNIIAAGASVWIVWRYWPRPAGSSIIWPVLLASVSFAHPIQGCQLTMWTLVLCIAGLTLVERRRGLAGGIVLGLAVAIKTLPAMLLGYCLLRRRWRAAAGMVLGVVLFDFVPSVAYFGWQGAWDEHRAWMQRAGWHSNQVQISDPLMRATQHKSNFSYSSVLARWLRDTPATGQVRLRGSPPPEVVESVRARLRPGEVLTLDPMPAHYGGWCVEHEDVSWMPHFHVANWSARTVLTIWAVTLAAGLGALCWITWTSVRRGSANLRFAAARQSVTVPGSEAAQSLAVPGSKARQSLALPDPGWPALAALWMLAIFWPSPMARHYYLAWAFPALVVVCGALQSELQNGSGNRRAGTRLLLAAVAAWVIGTACLGWPLVRWYGLHLGVLAVLTAATVSVWASTARLGRGASGAAQRTARTTPGGAAG